MENKLILFSQFLTKYELGYDFAVLNLQTEYDGNKLLSIKFKDSLKEAEENYNKRYTVLNHHLIKIKAIYISISNAFEKFNNNTNLSIAEELDNVLKDYLITYYTDIPISGKVINADKNKILNIKVLTVHKSSSDYALNKDYPFEALASVLCFKLLNKDKKDVFDNWSFELNHSDGKARTLMNKIHKQTIKCLKDLVKKNKDAEWINFGNLIMFKICKDEKDISFDLYLRRYMID